MTSNEFSKIEQEWYDMQHSVLGAKADEYATEDRLHNFKAISDLTRGKVTPLQVAMILRGKQVISLYDRVFSDEPLTEDFFNEKAGDDANYLVLAKALHTEELNLNVKPSSKRPTGSEHGGVIHHTPRNFYEEVVAHAKEDK